MPDLRSYEKAETKSLSTKDCTQITSTRIVKMDTENAWIQKNSGPLRAGNSCPQEHASITADLRDINGVVQV